MASSQTSLSPSFEKKLPLGISSPQPHWCPGILVHHEFSREIHETEPRLEAPHVDMSAAMAGLRTPRTWCTRTWRSRTSIARAVAPQADGKRAASAQDEEPKLCILYDSDCPACRKEVDMLQSRDQGKRLKFTDIADPSYEAQENGGVSYERAMRRIHAITEEGQVVTGIDAFRRAYENVGLGWVYAPTKIKAVQALAEKAYNVWAEYRLKLAGRPTLDKLMAERRERRKSLGLNPEDAD
eukprot:scaffold2636_cov340-Pavlova_lutheri.AAC.20